MIGCGGQLCPGHMIADGDFENIHARSREFAVALEHARA